MNLHDIVAADDLIDYLSLRYPVYDWRRNPVTQIPEYTVPGGPGHWNSVDQYRGYQGDVNRWIAAGRPRQLTEAMRQY